MEQGPGARCDVLRELWLMCHCCGNCSARRVGCSFVCEFSLWSCVLVRFVQVCPSVVKISRLDKWAVNHGYGLCEECDMDDGDLAARLKLRSVLSGVCTWGCCLQLGLKSKCEDQVDVVYNSNLIF